MTEERLTEQIEKVFESNLVEPLRKLLSPQGVELTFLPELLKLRVDFKREENTNYKAPILNYFNTQVEIIIREIYKKVDLERALIHQAFVFAQTPYFSLRASKNKSCVIKNPQHARHFSGGFLTLPIFSGIQMGLGLGVEEIIKNSHHLRRRLDTKVYSDSRKIFYSSEEIAEDVQSKIIENNEANEEMSNYLAKLKFYNELWGKAA